MVQLSESISINPNVNGRGSRRIRFLQMAGTWRNSWRNSTQTLESDEGLSKGQREDNQASPSRKQVKFPSSVTLADEIPCDHEILSEEELQRAWYNVSPRIRPSIPVLRPDDFCLLFRSDNPERGI